MKAIDNQFRARAMTRIAQANQARRMKAKHDVCTDFVARCLGFFDVCDID